MCIENEACCFINTEFWLWHWLLPILNNNFYSSSFAQQYFNYWNCIIGMLFLISIICFSCYHSGFCVGVNKLKLFEWYFILYVWVCTSLSWHHVVKGSASSFLFERDPRKTKFWNSVVWLDIKSVYILILL